MVHREITENGNRERSAFPITFCSTRQTPRMIIERKYCFPLSIMACFSCSVITRIFLNIYVFLRTMHRIRPQKLQNNCEKSGINIQINTKNMRNSFKNTKKRGFLQLFSNAQNINNYILLNSRIFCIFSALYKICLCYLCYERLHYLSEKVKERKNGFSQNYQQNLALGALKCVSDGIFYPAEG